MLSPLSFVSSLQRPLLRQSDEWRAANKMLFQSRKCTATPPRDVNVANTLSGEAKKKEGIIVNKRHASPDVYKRRLALAIQNTDFTPEIAAIYASYVNEEEDVPTRDCFAS